MSTAFAIGRDVFAVIGIGTAYFLAASGVGRCLKGASAHYPAPNDQDSTERSGS